MVKLYRKKPVVIEAIQWMVNDESLKELKEWGAPVSNIPNSIDLKIETLEDGNGQVDHIVSIWDWVIKGVNGEFYLCKPDIFKKSYEAVE